MKKIILATMVICLLFVSACAGGNGSDTADSSDGTVETVTNDGVETATQSFDKEAIKSQLDITELGFYVQPFANVTDYGYAAEVKNNSDQDIVLSCEVVFYGSDGAPVGTEKSLGFYVNSGGTALLFADGSMDEPEKAEMEIFVEEPDRYVLSNKLETKSTLRSDKVVIEMTNNSDMDAYLSGAAVAFYEGDKLIDCENCYAGNDDSILEAGNTRIGDVGWIGNAPVDTVKVYPNVKSHDWVD